MEKINTDGLKWLIDNFPNVRKLDINWTFERYDYPKETRQYIMDNWVRESDENGGTYVEPTYYKKNRKESEEQNEKDASTVEQSNTLSKPDVTLEVDDGKKYAQNYPFRKGMDEDNKKALDIMASKGMNEAIKHMFTEQETGKTRSYGQMRMMYG